VGAILDTSVLIEVLDAGNAELLDEILARYDGLLIPWVALYEYLYGHAYVGSDVRERKRLVEELGAVVWLDQRIVLRALGLDVGLSKNGLRIPFSDLLIAATALEAGGELVTLDERHFKRIEGLRVYVPRPARNPPH